MILCCWRVLLAGGWLALCLLCLWANGSVRITAYPNAVVADGASQILLTVEARTPQGRPVSDGTQVAFSTTLGTFREPIVNTEGGVARATLIASSLPGVATITVTVLGQATVGETQVLFVQSEEELRSAIDYVQVSGSEYLAYANEQRVIAGSGKEGGATVRFSFTTIHADDLQMEVDTLRVKARSAKLTYGSQEWHFSELSYDLRANEGVGIAERGERLEIVRLKAGQTEPYIGPVPPEWFEFVDISESELVIRARQIWFYPGERIQFHRAEFFIGEVSALSLPMYSHSLWGGGVGTDTLVGVESGQVYLDIPYYYTLQPNQIGALRLRTAQRGGRSLGTARGLFLDLEHEYRSGQGKGSFNFTGLVRDDWGVSWRHYQPLAPNTRFYVWLDSPAHRGLFGSTQISHQTRGYSIGLNLAGSTYWQGSRANSWRGDLFVEGTPRSLGDLPIRQSLSLRLSANRTNTGYSTIQREGVGVLMRWSLIPQSLDRSTTITGGLTVGQYVGNLPNAGWSMTGTLGLTRAVGQQGALSLTYDYSQDALGSTSLGRHRLSGSLFWNPTNQLYLTGYFSRALDTTALSYVADASWRLSDLWRVGAGLTWQTYQGYTFRDQTLTFAYRLGYRELALTWSASTRRWSFDLLTAFY
ncbi:MAG: invasin domain 3-containing protein [Fimbriimonadales bacterium]